MKILFEDQVYSPELLDAFGLSLYSYVSRDGNEAIMKSVGYVYSSKIDDSIFILPKVFLFEGKGDVNRCEVAFGQYHYAEIINISKEHNPLKEDGLDKVLFGLSTWLYRAIDRYSIEHPKSEIIKRHSIQRVNSHNGEKAQTLLDIVLSLIDFHKEHAHLFTYISIVNSTGNNKIHWGKTIRKVQPVIQDNEPLYAEFRNKNMAINYDEDLIVLFYSVLDYLRAKYFFPVRANLNYELIKPGNIESMIESGRGTKILRSIRRKYYKDELVLLWKLLYAFFDKSELIRSGKNKEEALLASSFNIVFEAMVDKLIGQDIFSDLKENADGKQIDHIYKEKSLLDDSFIYYIGDSKYYFADSKLGEESLYKQFTYAKNIIQLNIDIFNSPGNKRSAEDEKIIENVTYRDELTEGYNITPNFFVRGYIRAGDIKDGHAIYDKDHLSRNGQILPKNMHFYNRLFDRDTLILQAYNINFLYVLASYVNNLDNVAERKRIHDKFRNDLIRLFNEKYSFYKVKPLSDMETFVEAHFNEFHGKMYHSNGADFIWFAFEKETMSIERMRDRFCLEAEVSEAKMS